MEFLRKHKKGIWWLEEKNDFGWKFFLFLVSPFFAFLHSLRRMNTKSSYIVFFLFAVLFGLSFETSIGKDENISGDAAVYRWYFELGSSKGDFHDFVNEFTTFENEKARDLYLTTMVYLVSRVSRNYHLFFGVLAIVFAFFMLKSLKFLTEEDDFRPSFYCVLIAFFFVFRNGIFNINGCRFWTASWIAIYAVFQIFKNGNKSYILLAALTPLVHQAYWFYLFVLLIVFLSKRFVGFWKVLFFISFFVSSIAIEIIADISDYLPPALQFLVERYSGEVVWSSNLYQVIRHVFSIVFRIYLFIIAILFFRNEKHILSNPKTKNLYQYLLVFMTIVNSVMMVPSLGNRFQILCFPIMAYIWLVCFGNSHKYRPVLYCLPIVGLFTIYERLMNYLFFSVGIDFYVTSPILQIIRLFS